MEALGMAETRGLIGSIEAAGELYGLHVIPASHDDAARILPK